MTLFRTQQAQGLKRVGLMVLVLTSTACQKYTVGGAGTKTTESPDKTLSTANSNTVLKYGSGIQYHSGQTTTSDNTVTSLAVDMTTYCFDNSSSACVTAGNLRSDLGSNPVAIQSFQLFSGKKTGDVFNLQSGWFVTAEPRLDTAKGTFRYVDKQIRVLNGTSFKQAFSVSDCDPTDGNAVGFKASSADDQRILTGIQAYTDGNIGGGYDINSNLIGYNRTNVFLQAGKVWYSGFMPRLGSTSAPFQFDILPLLPSGETSYSDDNYAETATFGLNAEAAESGSGSFGLPKVGLSSSDEGALSSSHWYSHVIVGFCLKGTRTEAIDGTNGKTVTRPIFFGMDARTYKPVMNMKSAVSTK